MELKHLVSYASVVRLGSFSRAAEELYIAQPTISMHVRQLEEELQTKLLIRTTKNIELTEKGREVYECAVSILQLRDRILEKCSDGETRIIRLGASTIPSAYILPEVLPAYAKRHPSTYFTIDQGDSRSVAEKLTEGVIDIGLIGMKPSSSELSAEPFYEDTVVIITPVREPFLSMKDRGGATLQQLFEAPVILREEGSGSLKAADTFLARAGFSEKDLHVAARTNDPEAIKNQGSGKLQQRKPAARVFLSGNFGQPDTLHRDKEARGARRAGERLPAVYPTVLRNTQKSVNKSERF